MRNSTGTPMAVRKTTRIRTRLRAWFRRWARNYVWSSLVAQFVASDAFRSAPALPVNREPIHMSLLNDLKLSRRHALKGIVSGVGVSLWLPVLDVMCNESGTAFAAGTPLPTTFGIFFWGNGVYPGQTWTPSATGDGNAWQRPPALTAFANLKDYMTLVDWDGHAGCLSSKDTGWGVVYVLAGGDGALASPRRHRQVALRSAARNRPGDAVAADDRSVGRQRHLHQRALQVARDGHPEVHGHEHGNGEPESRPHRARTSLCRRSVIPEPFNTLFKTGARP